MFFAPVSRPVTVTPAARAFDRQFERFVSDVFGNSSAQVRQDDKAWTLSLDVPGVAREDLGIAVDGNVVRITTRPEAQRQYRFAYALPQDIDADATTAKLEHGVLTLSLAKKQPVVTARQIAIG